MPPPTTTTTKCMNTGRRFADGRWIVHWMSRLVIWLFLLLLLLAFCIRICLNLCVNTNCTKKFRRACAHPPIRMYIHYTFIFSCSFNSHLFDCSSALSRNNNTSNINANNTSCICLYGNSSNDGQQHTIRSIAFGLFLFGFICNRSSVYIDI